MGILAISRVKDNKMINKIYNLYTQNGHYYKIQNFEQK
jgi:hypothetical protein